LELNTHIPQMPEVSLLIESSSQVIIQTMYRYIELMAMLPVGSDLAKINFRNVAEGSIIVSARTYSGVRTKEDLPENRQRFSIATMYFENQDEVQNIIQLLIDQKLARVHVTKVIDLLGRPDSPNKVIQSFVSMFVGKKWCRISERYAAPQLAKEYDYFINLIHEKVYPPFFFNDEISTVSSFAFLQERFNDNFPGEIVQGIEENGNEIQISYQTIVDGCSAAFGCDRQLFINALQELRRNSENSSACSRLLHKSGTGDEQWREILSANANTLFSLIFDCWSYSALKPFNNSL
jgi:hypothetical protein